MYLLEKSNIYSEIMGNKLGMKKIEAATAEAAAAQ
jgi:hypothetical protein